MVTPAEAKPFNLALYLYLENKIVKKRNRKDYLYTAGSSCMLVLNSTLVLNSAPLPGKELTSHSIPLIDSTRLHTPG